MSVDSRREEIAHEVGVAADQAFASGNISGLGLGLTVVFVAYEGSPWGFLPLVFVLLGVVLWRRIDREWP